MAALVVAAGAVLADDITPGVDGGAGAVAAAIG